MDQGTWQPANPGESLLTPQDWIRVATTANLTARELEVTVLLFEGRSRGRIARKLKLSPGTVRVYIDRLYKKMRVRDKLGMALRVVRMHFAVAADSQRMSH